MARTDKASRRLGKVVDEAIRKHGNAATDPDATPVSPRLARRWDAAFGHMHRSHQRANRRGGA